MNTFFEKFRAFTRTYWQLFLLVAGGVLGAFLFRKRELGFAESVSKLMESHAEEMGRINAAREEEKRQHAENEMRLRASLEAVQSQYEIAKKELDDKKKKEIEEIVKQYGNDPVELAKQLSAATGFSIIMPP